VVIYGEPICVPAQVAADGLLAAQQKVEQRLQDITDMADRFF
jgi:hypothetical protein